MSTNKPKCVVCGKDRKPSPSSTITRIEEAHLDRLLDKKSNGDYAHNSCATDLGDAIGIATSDTQMIEWTEQGGCLPVGDTLGISDAVLREDDTEDES
jgi:hypothetical protein